MNDDSETVYPVIDRSPVRAQIAATIAPEAADADYAAWRERAGFPAES